jgi:radical SAM superfamily enzyme YgiQ (UPF0313 family)
VKTSLKRENEKFFVELIKPSHYDDDGYVIQWWKSFSLSNSLSCLYSLTLDSAERKILGENVNIIANLHDEHSTVIPIPEIIRRIRQNGNRGVIALVGVQTNQFPRSVDIARPFREAGIPVVIGGFHVSAAIAVLAKTPPEAQKALDMGITLFAGEAEGHLDQLLSDAYHQKLKPVYNVVNDLPDLQGKPTPFLPLAMIKKSLSSDIPIDTGRGCPFDCSFCTIINIQGQNSRFRTADDVERTIRSYPRNRSKTPHFFFTDDNFARNKNWEAIFDRLIELREMKGFKVKFGMQIDANAHKIPRFIDKAARAGCNSVFIGMESINKENLKAANKPQNNVAEYRKMLMIWRRNRVATMAGYILGFPADTPDSIENDIRTIQRELPIDILMFFILTALPGSMDHKESLQRGEWMESDLNKYDSEHATTKHPKMTREEWEGVFRKAWDIYYSPKHVEKVLRRASRDGISPSRLIWRLLISQFGIKYEDTHPFQCGAFRKKVRRQRRWGMPLENPLFFYSRRIWEIGRTTLLLSIYAWRLERLKKSIKKDSRELPRDVQ